MTQVTTGPDGQTRFAGMTVGQLAAEVERMATRFKHNGFPDNAAGMFLAVAALRHLSARVEELEGRPLTMEGFTDADIDALKKDQRP